MPGGEPPPVFLLTSYYPFARGEEFLPAEFPYLLAEFGQVILLPTKVRSSQLGSARALSSGVELGASFLDELIRRRRSPSWLRLMRAVASAGFFNLMGKELASALRFGPAGFRALLVRHVKADEILTALERARLPIGEGALYYAYWMDESALALSRLKKTAPASVVVSRAHGFDLYPHRQDPPYQPAQRAIVAGLDRVYPVSAHGAGDLRDRLPEAEPKLRVFRLGVPGVAARARPSEDGVLRLLTCAHATRVKRLDRLAEALHEVDFPVLWTQIGGGPRLPALQAMSGSLPAHVEVCWLGQLPHAEVLEYYRSNPVDLFLNVSESEGIPATIMEALSAGVPVMATDVGGVSEIVNEDNGVLLGPAGSTAEIVAALRSFHGLPPARREAMRQEAFRSWQQNANAPTQFRSFAVDLKGLLASAGSAQ